jgi:hypothetical protein
MVLNGYNKRAYPVVQERLGIGLVINYPTQVLLHVKINAYNTKPS